jgi:hypothetical protein
MKKLVISCFCFTFICCAPKSIPIKTPCRSHFQYLASVIKFDKIGKYYLLKPSKYAHLPNHEIMYFFAADMSCDNITCMQGIVTVKDVEKLFGIKLKYDTQGYRVKHNGKGFMYPSQEEILAGTKQQDTPDLIFFFSKNGKYVTQVVFDCNLHR